jgi:uncharacterized protein (TIGR00369 family)
VIKNSIWYDVSPFDYASSRWKNCAIDHLGIEMVEAGTDFLKARMPVDERTRQPTGILHGGVSVVLAETLASCAAAFTLDRSKQHCVGLSINANHVRSVKEGYVLDTIQHPLGLFLGQKPCAAVADLWPAHFPVRVINGQPPFPAGDIEHMKE